MDPDPDRRGEEMRARGDYESGPLVRSVAMSTDSVHQQLRKEIVRASVLGNRIELQCPKTESRIIDSRVRIHPFDGFVQSFPV